MAQMEAIMLNGFLFPWTVGAVVALQIYLEYRKRQKARKGIDEMKKDYADSNRKAWDFKPRLEMLHEKIADLDDKLSVAQDTSRSAHYFSSELQTRLAAIESVANEAMAAAKQAELRTMQVEGAYHSLMRRFEAQEHRSPPPETTKPPHG